MTTRDWVIIVIYSLVLAGQYALRRYDRKKWKKEWTELERRRA
jgi:hypothetical protein